MSTIGLYVYEDDDKTMADLISQQLRELSENGCDINLEQKSFSVVDINIFSEYMLSTKFSGWPNQESASSLGKLLHDVLRNSYLHFPTFFDGEPYDSLFDALRWILFSNDERNDEEYILAGVYEGSY